MLLGVGGAAALQILGPVEHDGRVQAASVGLRPNRVLPPTVTDAVPSPPGDVAVSPAVAEVPASAAAEPAPPPAAPERRAANPASPPAGISAPARPNRPRVRQVVRRDTVPAEPPPSPVEREPSQFIGVYATGPDGVRVFRSNP